MFRRPGNVVPRKPLVTKAGINKADFGGLHLRAGEFMADEVEDLMDDERLVETACGLA